MRLATSLLSLGLLVPVTLAYTAPRTASPTQPAALQKKGVHEDKRFGFQFKPPKDWSGIALKTDEAWLAAKYRSDKSYFFTDPDTKFTHEHTPELLMIAFIKENMKKKKQEVTESEEDGEKQVVVEINNPYKNYQDFLDRTYSGGGFYIDKTEKTKVDDLDVTIYHIKVEKLTIPKRIETWVYHTEDIDFALQIEVLESENRKLQKLKDRSYKSFEQIERTEGRLPTSGATEDGIRITFRDMNTGTDKERKTKRVESQKQLQARAINQLPEDWDHIKVGDTLILTHTDRKYTDRVGDHVKIFMKWLDKEFDYIGPKQYVRAPIIRICESAEEEGSFTRGVRTGSEGVFSGGQEIVTHKDQAGFIGGEIGYVNRRLLDHWLDEKDSDLNLAMPMWLRNGLYEYVDGARADGRKLDFRADDWSRDNARLAISKGEATSPRELIAMTREEFVGGGQGYWGRTAESVMFVRFLMSPEARRCKQAKTLIKDYILALDQVVEAQKAADEASSDDDPDRPKTEEEEEEMAKARAERWRARERQLMEDVFTITFGDWDEGDWEKLEKAYFDFAG